MILKIKMHDYNSPQLIVLFYFTYAYVQGAYKHQSPFHMI
jgi:hypothetical protein